MNNRGYYTVNNKIFFEKIEAIVHANQTLADIKWHFHNDIFNNLEWTVEPSTSMTEFYKLRAQQIRDKYDYVIVMCSGGADSTNVLYSFLDNNIHVDEVIASAPLEGMSNYSQNNKNKSAENTVSETAYAQLPLLNEISTKYPNVKITLNDYFYDMVNYKSDEWLYKSSDWIHPTTVARYSLEKYTHIKNLAEQGKQIAVVYGIDKPVIVQDDSNDLYSVIADLTVNVPRPPFDTEYPNVETVLFYWAADMPLMMVKQSHEVARWLHQPENSIIKSYMRNNVTANLCTVEQNRQRHSLYDRGIIPCLYPTMPTDSFQCAKSIRIFLSNHDDWFYKLHNNTRIYQQIESDFQNFTKNINIKYFNKSKSGFVMQTQMYRIGNVSQFLK
jgi:hypothetical protein